MFLILNPIIFGNLSHLFTYKISKNLGESPPSTIGKFITWTSPNNSQSFPQKSTNTNSQPSTKSMISNFSLTLKGGQSRVKWTSPIWLSSSLSIKRWRQTLHFTSNFLVALRAFKVENKHATVTCRKGSESFSFSSKDWKRVSDGTKDYSLIIRNHQPSLYQMQSWSMVSIIWATEISETSWNLINTSLE